MRRDPAVVARMAAAELRGDQDWMGVVAVEQARIAAEHGVDLVEMRLRGRRSELVPWSKLRANRETAPLLKAGQQWSDIDTAVLMPGAGAAPATPVSLHDLNNAPAFRVGASAGKNRLWVWSSGS